MLSKMFFEHLHLPSELIPNKRSSTRTNTYALVTYLQQVLHDHRLYRQLLHFKNSDAQALLDTFQSLLDVPELDTQFRRLLIVATQRLSEHSGLYPVCYRLKGVEQVEAEPVTAGGFADIYKAKFQGQVVCLKVIRLYQNSQLEYVLKKVTKEVILWRQLFHPNILPMYGIYRYNNQLCLVAPWMENGNIAAYLKQNLKADRAALSVDVTQGLRYLHMNNVVHGDLKSSNILIDEAGRARLCDFGISCVSDPDIVAWTSQSSMSSRGGSIRWQAPELLGIENDESVKNSKPSDVYALGCVFYEIQYGYRPLRPSKSDPAWREWGLTKSIWALIEACWKSNPSKRPATEQVLQRICHSDLQRNPNLRPRPIPFSAGLRQRMSEPLEETCKAVSVKLLRNIIQSVPARNSTVTRDRRTTSVGLQNSGHFSSVPGLPTDFARPPHFLERKTSRQLDKFQSLGWGTLRDSDQPKEATSLHNLAKFDADELCPSAPVPQENLRSSFIDTPTTTLFVGNLPPAWWINNFSSGYLEDSLRKLFSLRAGFRQLIFRQKNIGPMCFVEFEDVAQATKALNELHGNTLNGLVKDGIRLMYGKKPIRFSDRPSTSMARKDVPQVLPTLIPRAILL
ncbi:hypothetical protein C0989_010464 [Termitomyces sp. Mn162]|nr:hypothetical protein C0989_010464 [Termitomyces sp. Mn162]